jgi:hypothetical protein
MIFASAPLVISAPLSSTKKRTLFSRLPLSEPTINQLFKIISLDLTTSFVANI